MSVEDFLKTTHTKGPSHALGELPLDIALNWESETASAVSPGVVQDCEPLLRAIDQPNHWNRVSGEFTPYAFTEAETHGLSVYRENYSQLVEISTHANLRLVDKLGPVSEGVKEKRRLVGFVCFPCCKVRGLTGKGLSDSVIPERLVVVFDTAKEGSTADRAHADILVRAKEKILRKRARSDLFDLAKSGLRNLENEPITCEAMAAVVAGL